jgi:hypothetical protein
MLRLRDGAMWYASSFGCAEKRGKDVRARFREEEKYFANFESDAVSFASLHGPFGVLLGSYVTSSQEADEKGLDTLGFQFVYILADLIAENGRDIVGLNLFCRTVISHGNSARTYFNPPHSC